MGKIFTDKSFKQDIAKDVVLVEFWAPWCGPCKIQGPILEDIAQEYEGNDKIKIGKVNVDENPNTAQEFQVMSIPTLIVYKDGELVEQMIGLQNKETLKQQIDKHLL